MTESLKDCNYIQRFGKSLLCSPEDGLEGITIDLYEVQKSAENDVARVWEGKKRAV